MPPVIAFYWSRAPRRYAEFPDFLATYTPGGKAPAAGDVFRNPDLATTYERIARGGCYEDGSARAARRLHAPATAGSPKFGLRVARSQEE